MQPPMKQGMSNDFQTPKEALIPLLKYIKPNWIIWECASGKGNIVNELQKNGLKVIQSDILNGFDFLKYEPKEYDCVITNPPYSLKQQFLQRCYDLKKPFALLLPLTTFETKKMQELFKKHGIQIIFFDKRVNFDTPSGVGSGSWFATAWFTWGLNLEKDMLFENLEV